MDVFIYFEQQIPGFFGQYDLKCPEMRGIGSVPPASFPLLGKDHGPATHADKCGTCAAGNVIGIHIGVPEPFDLDDFALLELESDLLNEGIRTSLFADPYGRLQFLEEFIFFDVLSPPDNVSDDRRHDR